MRLDWAVEATARGVEKTKWSKRVWREESLTGGVSPRTGSFSVWMGVSKTGGVMDMPRRRISESDCAEYFDCRHDKRNVMPRSRL